MKQLAQKLKKLLKKNKVIEDLVIFGSLAKNKLRVNDIDIAVIANGTVDKIKLEKEIETFATKEVHLQIITIKDYDQFIWITLIREGYSVKHGDYLSKVYGIKPMVLYKYSLKELTPSQKVMFSRAIKNFKDIEKLSNRVVLVPMERSGEFYSFLRTWDIDLDSVEYGLLPLVRPNDLFD